MNKFYLIPLSLILLGPSFADDMDSGQTSYEYTILTSNETKDSQTEQKKEERKKRLISRDEKLLAQKKRTLSEHLASRKKHAPSAKEAQSQKGRISKRTLKTPPQSKTSKNLAESQKLPPTAKETAPQKGQTPKQPPKRPPQSKTPKNIAEPQKLPPTAKETAPQKRQTQKQLPKHLPQSKTSKSLAESQKRLPEEKVSKLEKSPKLNEAKKDPLKPEIKERMEREKQRAKQPSKFPKSLGPQNSVMNKQAPAKESTPIKPNSEQLIQELLSKDLQSKQLSEKQKSDPTASPDGKLSKSAETPQQVEKPSDSKQIAEQSKLPSFPVEDSATESIEKEPIDSNASPKNNSKQIAEQSKFPSFPIEDSATESIEKEPIDSKASPKNKRNPHNPSERKGKYFAPFARKESSLSPSIPAPSRELSEKDRANNPNTNEKEAIGSTPFQKPSNSKETSSTYDRHIRRQNHHSMSENSPQNNSSTEENSGSKSSASQKKIEFENLQAQRENEDSGQLDVIGSSQPETQKLPNPPSQPFYPKKCETPFHMMHVGLRHTEARGVGYKDGYTTLEGFGIYNGNSYFMPFIDLRGHVFDNGKFAGNAGIGGRSFFPSLEHILSYYLYYDVRQDNHHLTAQQLGPGIELLGKRMEYRMNGYFPVGDRKSHKYDYDFDQFKGNDILLKAKQRDVMTGGDAEIGAHLTQSTKYDLYTGAGPYYFSSSHASSWGGKVRLLGRFKEYVSLEASYSYDHLFKSVIQGSVAINLPFGKRIKRKGNDCSSQINLALSRAAFSPYRFEIPVIKRVFTKQKAINPATDDPWKVWFVNNTSSSNGTFESPFPTLVQAQNASGPNDMIYVFPGDGTSTGMNLGISLQNGQTLFGSGIAHKIATTKGTIKIPAFSNTSPLITNTGTNVVTLANGNEVSGFNINLSSSDGIFGASINGTQINNNTIFGNASFGAINVAGFGNVKIANNQIYSQANSGSGIEVFNTGSMQLKILNNSISGFGEAIDVLSPASPNITGNVLISGNQVANFLAQGINYSDGWSNATVSIIGNAIANTTGTSGSHGILANVSNFPNAGTVIVSDNQVATTSSNMTLGIAVQPGANHIQLTTIINNNNILTGSGSGSTGIGVFGNFSASSNICASIFNNTVAGATPGTNGIAITSGTGAGSTTINVDNFSGNVDSNILISGNVNFVPEAACE